MSLLGTVEEAGFRPARRIAHRAPRGVDPAIPPPRGGIERTSAGRRAGTGAQEPAARRRQRDRVERVAEHLFAARGYRGASMHLVAARAGCSVGHLYNLHGNKLGLYRAILESKMDELGGVVERAVEAEGTTRMRLERVLGQVLRFFQKNSAFFRIYAVETEASLRIGMHSLVERTAHRHASLLQKVADLVQEGQERGELRGGIDPTLVAISLIGMVKGHTNEWLLRGRAGSLLDQAAGILDLSFNGLLCRQSRGGRAK